MDCTTKDVGHLCIGVENRRTERKWLMERRGVGACEQMKHVFGGLFEIVTAREGRESNFFGEKIYLEDIAFMKSVGKVAFPTTVVFEGRADIPADFAVFTERGAGIGRGVRNNLGTHGGKWSPVKVELAEEGGMSR